MDKLALLASLFSPPQPPPLPPSPSAGSVAINDVSITEGNSGSQLATFTVTRSGGTLAFDVNVATADASATVAGLDYLAHSDTLHFLAGETSHTFQIAVNGDTTIEPNETFAVNLSGATNGATISDGHGVGTIINDDGAPPIDWSVPHMLDADHFLLPPLNSAPSASNQHHQTMEDVYLGIAGSNIGLINHKGAFDNYYVWYADYQGDYYVDNLL